MLRSRRGGEASRGSPGREGVQGRQARGARAGDREAQPRGGRVLPREARARDQEAQDPDLRLPRRDARLGRRNDVRPRLLRHGARVSSAGCSWCRSASSVWSFTRSASGPSASEIRPRRSSHGPGYHPGHASKHRLDARARRRVRRRQQGQGRRPDRWRQRRCRAVHDRAGRARAGVHADAGQTVSVAQDRPGLGRRDARDLAAERRPAVRRRAGRPRSGSSRTSSSSPTPFLDIIEHDIVAGGEQGLLGLAFHPNYASNGYFYVLYTAGNATDVLDVVARYTVSATDPNKADPASDADPAVDPRLRGEPQRRHDRVRRRRLPLRRHRRRRRRRRSASQRQATPHATTCANAASRCSARSCASTSTIRRTASPTASRPTTRSPRGGGEPEIFMIGVRNPWRWSFDRRPATCGSATSARTSTRSSTCSRPASRRARTSAGACTRARTATTATTPRRIDRQDVPAARRRTTTSDGWHAIIGGQVYRGPCYPDLVGKYFYTDNTRHGLSVATFDGTATSRRPICQRRPAAGRASPASIHADARGELYMTTTNGSVYHIEAGP